MNSGSRAEISPGTANLSPGERPAPRPGCGRWWSTLLRVARYTAVKALILFATVVVGIYLTILVVNLGDHVDEIFRGQIEHQVGLMIYGGWLKGVAEPEWTEIIEQTIWEMEEAKGLHRPFLKRSGRRLVGALAFAGLGFGLERVMNPRLRER